VFTFTHTTSGGGIWNSASDWSPAEVPGDGNTALLTKAGTYALSSTQNNSVAVIETASAATLVVDGGTVFAVTSGTGTGANTGKIVVADGATLELGGTFSNNGSITLNGSASSTRLEVDGAALTLSGAGRVTLSDSPDNAIVPVSGVATITNVQNTIAGAGTLGNTHLALINQSGGSIDGNGLHNALTLSGTTSNAGVLEGTTSRGLVIAGAVTNSKTLEAVGTSATVAIASTVINTSVGVILASGVGANVDLDGATISGGTLRTIGTGAVIETVSGTTNTIAGATIAGGSLVEATSGSTLTISGGTIGPAAIVETATSGTAIVSGTVSNSGTLFASGSGSLVEIANGAVVNGGVAEVGNGIVDIKGASSEKVTFQAGGSGGLQLDDPLGYTGKVIGFGVSGGISHADHNQYIDLTSVTYSAGEIATYSANSSNTGGVLTVSSGGQAVAKINLVGAYVTSNFHVRSGIGNTLEITDPSITEQQPGETAAAIAGGTVLEINTPDSVKVIFGGSGGTLWLDQAETFAGTVAGFGAQGRIDLSNIGFGSQTTLGNSENKSDTGGTLTITDGTHTAAIALFGNYMASTLVAGADGHGGTLVTETPLPGQPPLLAHPNA
jgi:hypothetical protein